MRTQNRLALATRRWTINSHAAVGASFSCRIISRMTVVKSWVNVGHGQEASFQNLHCHGGTSGKSRGIEGRFRRSYWASPGRSRNRHCRRQGRERKADVTLARVAGAIDDNHALAVIVFPSEGDEGVGGGVPIHRERTQAVAIVLVGRRASAAASNRS